MVGPLEAAGPVENHGLSSSHQKLDLGFSVLHQRVQLDIDLALRKLRGSTEITISPHSADLKTIRLNCRQCSLNRLSVNGKPSASAAYTDPYKRSKLNWQADVHQHHMLQERIEGVLKVPPPEPELVVNLPKSTKIYELDPMITLDSAGRYAGDIAVVDLSQSNRPAVDQTTRFSSITICVDFSIDEIRDGMQFCGWSPGDLQYPHAYSQHSIPGSACCLFPCVDALDSRSTWEIAIKCARTIGDAFPKLHSSINGTNGTNETNGADVSGQEADELPSFSDEEKALDLVVICSGDMTDEVSGHLSSAYMY